MGIKVSLFVISLNGESLRGTLYGDYEVASEIVKGMKEYDRRDKVEINKETFDESELYFTGDCPERGPVYILLAELNKKPVPWSEKFKPTGPMDKKLFFTKTKGK